MNNTNEKLQKERNGDFVSETSFYHPKYCLYHITYHQKQNNEQLLLKIFCS